MSSVTVTYANMVIDPKKCSALLSAAAPVASINYGPKKPNRKQRTAIKRWLKEEALQLILVNSEIQRKEIQRKSANRIKKAKKKVQKARKAENACGLLLASPAKPTSIPAEEDTKVQYKNNVELVSKLVSTFRANNPTMPLQTEVGKVLEESNFDMFAFKNKISETLTIPFSV